MILLKATLGVALIGCLGCPKDESPPADDRLIQKLQAEKSRLDQGGPVARPMPSPIAEPDPLAARAAMPDAPKTLALIGASDFSCGVGACRVTSVETSHNVAREKMSLTSGEYFFKVTLSTQIARGGPLDFTAAKLVAGTEEYPIARDAQRLAGTRELARTYKPGEKADVVLMFEAPSTAIAPGLKLIVAGGDGVSLQ